MDEKKKLTTNAGAPIVDNQNIMTAGPRGPALLQDVWFQEKLAHFDREVIPERRMHAKGSGAYGTFTVTHDITRYTKAKIFSTLGKKTDLFTRFSTVAGERGAADAERDIRGFAIKFYTEQGNWDLLGNNTPVFFLRDPLKFPALNHAVKRDPRTNLRSALNNWDFWTSLPEALHPVTIVMSDRGIPATYRHGFGGHTFSLLNAKNERYWVKFHLRTEQGIKNLTDEEAEALVGKDRESHQRALYDSIERRNSPAGPCSSKSCRRRMRQSAPTTTGPCGWTANTAARWATSRTATASGKSSRTLPSRLSAWKGPPITGTTARIPTITASPGSSSGSCGRTSRRCSLPTPHAPSAERRGTSRSATSAIV